MGLQGYLNGKPNAVGINIGSASHCVAVPKDRDDEPVREFPSVTADLQRLANWLTECGVDTVSMESTGVYWIPLYELFDVRGFTVLLVNAQHPKNVSPKFDMKLPVFRDFRSTPLCKTAPYIYQPKISVGTH